MKTIKKYLWLWEFIGVALIVIVGLIAKFVTGALYAIVGATILVLGLLRLIPLFKTTFDKVLKWVYTAEIIANIVIGGLLVYFAFNGDDIKSIFGYLVGAVLYARGFIYYYSTVLRKEDTDKPKFIAHVIFFTLGTVIIARGGFDESYLGWVVFAISMLTALFVGYGGYNNYRNYRNEYAAKSISKKVKKTEVEAPTADEIKVPVEENVPTEIIEEKKENEINA